MVNANKPAWLSWFEVFKRGFHKAGQDDISMRSAQLAYYFFLSIFPLAVFIISIVLIFAARSAHFRAELFVFVGRIAPSSPLLRRTMRSLAAAKSGTGPTAIGIIVALWSASSGMSALMDALNAQYHVKESRPFVKRSLRALALTIATGIVLLIAVGIALIGANQVSAIGGGGFIREVWNIARWPVVLAFALFDFDLIYHFAPRVHREWHWISVGAVTALVVWIAASVGFRIYLSYFNHYSSTYGPLGAVVVLLLWFYITGFAILFGSEVNIVVESAAIRHLDSGDSTYRSSAA